MSNRSLTPGEKTVRVMPWDEFEALPRHIKEVLWSAPVSVSIPPGNRLAFEDFPAFLKAYREINQGRTISTWGPDHPQAQERNG